METFTTHNSNNGSVTTAGVIHRDVVNNHNVTYVTAPLQREKEKKVLFGYYESWAEYVVNEIGKFSIEDINVKKLTHVAWAYIKINDDGSVNMGDVENCTNSERFRQFLHLKRKNPEVKLLISIGGWMENPNIHEEVFGDDSKLDKLCNGLVDLMETYKFDGLDLAWVYPEERHKNLFTKFFAKLRNMEKFRPPFILSAAIRADIQVGATYDLKELEKHLDFFNIFFFGFVSNDLMCTQHNAPLTTIRLIMREWIRLNVDFNKILLGIELGGKKFRLRDSNNNGPGAACIDLDVGEVTLIKAFEVNALKNDQWTTVDGPRGDYTYAYCGDQWISHESNYTVQAKAQYASDNKMAGIVLMAVNYEGSGKNPLLDAIDEELNK